MECRWAVDKSVMAQNDRKMWDRKMGLREGTKTIYSIFLSAMFLSFPEQPQSA